MKEWNVNRNEKFLLRHMGSMGQIAGLKHYVFSDGKSSGIEAVDVCTGSGFDFTVLPGRGMDIAWARYKGVPVSYMSKTGVVSPAYYESEGMEWLRGFFAGLVTTCGLSNVGGPCEEEHRVIGMRRYGLHGRISNTAADNVQLYDGWKDGQYRMQVSGRVREAILHGENLSLRRTVTAELGEPGLTVQDEIRNEGCYDEPVMLLYHINIGYPILSDDSRVFCASRKIIPNDDNALRDLKDFDICESPQKGKEERCFFHDFAEDGKGMVHIALINEKLELGVALRYKKAEMPHFTQWKMLAENEYVMGFEPGNCHPVGRTRARETGQIQTLAPGECINVTWHLYMLDGAQEIERYTQKIASLK